MYNKINIFIVVSSFVCIYFCYWFNYFCLVWGMIFYLFWCLIIFWSWLYWFYLVWYCLCWWYFWNKKDCYYGWVSCVCFFWFEMENWICSRVYDVGFVFYCFFGFLVFVVFFYVGFLMFNFVICEMSLKMYYNVGKDFLFYMFNFEVFNIENGFIGLFIVFGLGIEFNEDMIRKEVVEVVEFEFWINFFFWGEDGVMWEW